MLLALDVGNTNITLGVYEGEKLLFVTRMATNPPRMEDEYASAMLSILHLYNIHTSQVNGAVLSSVVPRLTDDLARAVRRVWKVEPFIVSAQSVPELKVKRDDEPRSAAFFRQSDRAAAGAWPQHDGVHPVRHGVRHGVYAGRSV